LNETRSHVLALFRVAPHSLAFSGSPPGSLRCAVHSRSAARRQLRFGGETPSSPLVPPSWSLTTSATYSATYALQRPCSPCSEEHSKRRPKTPLVASLPACRAKARQPFVGRAHRVGLVASRLPSWGSLHFTPRSGSHETRPCSPARIRDDLLGHRLSCPRIRRPLSSSTVRRTVSPPTDPATRQMAGTESTARCTRPKQLPTAHTPLEDPHRQRDIASPRPLPSWRCSLRQTGCPASGTT